MTRPALLLLRLRVRLRHVNTLTLFALLLSLVVAFALAFLWNGRHHPPAGTYIAVVGILAVAVTFRKNPPTEEKAAWILLIILTTMAEVRNLYVAAGEQRASFAAIENQLTTTVTKLGVTAQAINASLIELGRLSEKVESTQKTNEAHFKATVSRLEEAIDGEIGGDTFCYFLPRFSFQDDTFSISIYSKGKYPLYNLFASVTDARYLELTNDFARMTIFSERIGDLSPNGGVDLPARVAFRSPGERQKLSSHFSGKNGSWDELIELARWRGIGRKQ